MIEGVSDKIRGDAKIDEEIRGFTLADTLLQRETIDEVDVGAKERRIGLQEEVDHGGKKIIG